MTSATWCTTVSKHLTSGHQNNVTVPLPKKGDLTLMTNYREISLMSIAAKMYNRLLLNRIRDHIDALLRSNQAGFRKGRGCVEQIHILRRIIEGVRLRDQANYVQYLLTSVKLLTQFPDKSFAQFENIMAFQKKTIDAIRLFTQIPAVQYV